MKTGASFDSRKQVIAHVVALMHEALSLDSAEYDEIHERRDEIGQLALAFDIGDKTLVRLWSAAQGMKSHPAIKLVQESANPA